MQSSLFLETSPFLLNFKKKVRKRIILLFLNVFDEIILISKSFFVSLAAQIRSKNVLADSTKIVYKSI